MTGDRRVRGPWCDGVFREPAAGHGTLDCGSDDGSAVGKPLKLCCGGHAGRTKLDDLRAQASPRGRCGVTDWPGEP